MFTDPSGYYFEIDHRRHVPYSPNGDALGGTPASYEGSSSSGPNTTYYGGKSGSGSGGTPIGNYPNGISEADPQPKWEPIPETYAAPIYRPNISSTYNTDGNVVKMGGNTDGESSGMSMKMGGETGPGGITNNINEFYNKGGFLDGDLALRDVMSWVRNSSKKIGGKEIGIWIMFDENSNVKYYVSAWKDNTITENYNDDPNAITGYTLWGYMHNHPESCKTALSIVDGDWDNYAKKYNCAMITIGCSYEGYYNPQNGHKFNYKMDAVNTDNEPIYIIKKLPHNNDYIPFRYE